MAYYIVYQQIMDKTNKFVGIKIRGTYDSESEAQQAVNILISKGISGIGMFHATKN